MVIRLNKMSDDNKLIEGSQVLTEQDLYAMADALHMAAGLYFENLKDAAELVQLGEDAVGESYNSIIAIQTTSIRQITDVKAVLDKLQAASGMDLITPNSSNYDDLIKASEVIKQNI